MAAHFTISSVDCELPTSQEIRRFDNNCDMLRREKIHVSRGLCCGEQTPPLH